LIVGGGECLGVPSVLVGVCFLVRGASDLSLQTLADTPAWQTLLGLCLGLVGTYAIGVQATRMRLRLEFYEPMLSSAWPTDTQGRVP
jgi:hypothetical protein